MESYLASLLESALPLPPWAVAMVLVALLLANHVVVRSVRLANEAQNFIAVEDWTPFRRVTQPKALLVQSVVVGIVLLLGLDLGGAAYVFLVGGMIVFLACHLGLNLQGMLSARGLARPAAATGSLKYSTAAAFRHISDRILGAAVASLVAGLALGHLALLGGAMLLASSAFGSWRRSQNVGAQS